MTAEAPLFEARGVRKSYALRRGLTVQRVTALDDVDVAIGGQRITALLGRSGSGKSTLARCLAGLEPPDAGRVFIAGEDVGAARGARLARLRRSAQLILQDPGEALNPRFRARDAVEEPLRVAGVRDPQALRARGDAALDAVGLGPELAERYTLEMSGGQRRRLLIARALAADPRALILDESLTGLDRSLQAQLLNLLLELRERRAVGLVIVSHEPDLIRAVAEEVVVMEAGRVVEHGPATRVLASPAHGETRALLDASRRTRPGAWL